ncbi:unnamed protein product [Brassica oleracea var. botrytis]
MTKFLCSYLVISMFVLSAFLALPNAQKICRVNPNLRKACSFQECTPPLSSKVQHGWHLYRK